MPAIVTELFGTKNVGAIYGWLSVSPMLGSFFLSTKVFSYVYDSAMAKQLLPSSSVADQSGILHQTTDDVFCTGGACFANAFWAGALCSLVSGTYFQLTTFRLPDCPYSSCEGTITTRRDFSLGLLPRLFTHTNPSYTWPRD